MRKGVMFNTFKRVEEFIKNLKTPMCRRDISKRLNVDYNSLKYIIKSLDKNLLKNVKESKNGKTGSIGKVSERR